MAISGALVFHKHILLIYAFFQLTFCRGKRGFLQKSKFYQCLFQFLSYFHETLGSYCLFKVSPCALVFASMLLFNLMLCHRKRGFHVKFQFLAPLAVGQRAYVMARCPSCVRPSVNFFFKHLLR